MTTRFTASLVLSCALSALAAGCTVHTYSARPEYPSTVFVSHGSPARHEASFHTTRSPERTQYQTDNHRATQADARERATRQRTVSRREVAPRSDANKPRASTSAKPSRSERSTEKPRTGKTDEHVVLMPEEPAKPKPEKDRGRALSFRERLEQYVDEANHEVAQDKRERRKRISRAIDAAADANE